MAGGQNLVGVQIPGDLGHERTRSGGIERGRREGFVLYLTYTGDAPWQWESKPEVEAVVLFMAGSCRAVVHCSTMGFLAQAHEREEGTHARLEAPSTEANGGAGLGTSTCNSKGCHGEAQPRVQASGGVTAWWWHMARRGPPGRRGRGEA